jgi:type I restriction-modification system DNA methylase subunit
MPLTLSQLESYLWEAATILRGPVDAAGFKTYVFPLLFFKRLSDVNDEEHAAALIEFEGDGEAMNRLRESAEAAFSAEERLVGKLEKEGLLA